MNKHRIFALALGVIWAIFMVWFVVLYVTHTFTQTLNFYTNLYGIIPLIGGIYGLRLSWRWGGFKSAIGSTIFFLSLGLITYSTGLAIWLYYNIILQVEIPYPSIADWVFILSWPLWTIGAIFLSFATGATQGLKNIKGKLFLLAIPIIIAAASYYVLVVVARGGVISTYDDALKTFFDLSYPIGDVVILTIVTLLFGLSRTYLGGRYKNVIYIILAAFVINYIADFMFAYTTTLGTYYNGSMADALYVTTLTLLSIGIAGFQLPDYKNKTFSIITPSAANETTVFHEMIIRIIKKQERIIGISAWYEANDVPGFTIDKNRELVSFLGDGKNAVDRLIIHYEKVFGKASKGVCKEAVPGILAKMTPDQIPASLL